ncbi:MAG: hypothetical protein AAFY17_11455, partial [Cyanobacteria bacterium J06642_11]
DELFKRVGSLLPDQLRQQRQQSPQASQVSLGEALQIIDAFKLDERELVRLLSELKENGVLNGAIAQATLSKVMGQTVIDLCEILPHHLITKPVALLAIRRRRRTHYIGTLMPWTQIAHKDTLLKKLQAAPIKTWWRR